MLTSSRDGERRRLVEALHEAAPRIVLAVTGGGFFCVTDLLHVPGASATVLEATVPYAEAALAELIGGSPEQAVSGPTARAMAKAAHGRALEVADGGGHVFGVACTAALATNRPKRGEHRAHVAVLGDNAERSWALTLDKGARDRVEEDRVVADLVLVAIATAFDLEHSFDLGLLAGDELLAEHQG